MSSSLPDKEAEGRARKLSQAESLLRDAPADLRELSDDLLADPLFQAVCRERAQLHCAAGSARLHLGEVAEAIDHFEAARAILTGCPPTDPLSIRIENGLGAAWHLLGRYAEADRAFTNALAHARKSGDRNSLMSSLANLGYVKSEAGRHEDAVALLAEAVRTGGTEVLPKGRGKGYSPVLGDLGLALFRLGKVEQARRAIDRSIHDARVRGDSLTLAGSLASRAETLLPLQPDRAEEDLAESLSICLRLGANLAGVRSALLLARVATDMGNLEEAEAIIAEWTPRAARCDSLRHVQLVRLKGRLLSLRSRWEEAYAASEEAGELERRVGVASIQSAMSASESDRLARRSRRLAERVEGWNESVTLTLASLIEARDAPTGGHVERTGEIVRILGEWLIARGVYPGFNRAKLELVVKSTPLHDIGKIALTDQVLRKPGPLSPEERIHIEEHVVVGKAILLDAAMRIGSEPRIMTAAEIAGYHHERWDGSGYPEGLSGEAIPISARIVAVADVYDAMRSPRPYKPALDHETARDYLEESSGRHFDPRAVEAFLANEDAIAALYD